MFKNTSSREFFSSNKPMSVMLFSTQKLKTLSSVGEFKGELGDLTVHVSFDDKTIKISDRGIGIGQVLAVFQHRTHHLSRQR